MSYKLTFQYNHLGFGALCIWKNDRSEECFPCRTGSINGNEKLVNAIRPGIWTAREDVVKTSEIAMVVDGVGFKLRLWTPEGAWSHYLIHPDGNKPGSEGCIVSLKNHSELGVELKQIMAAMRVLPVEVGITL